MTGGVRVAVTGAGGRLGSQVLAALATRAFDDVFAWDIPEHDLDDPASASRLVTRDRPDVVVHCAAWTDVDGCARQPEVALRRNGEATGELAAACAGAGAALVVVSTNEVFDGTREDGRGYRIADEVRPINPYGASKLAGERAARAAMSADRLAIVRTAWLFGPGAPDFPRKILAAARRAQKAGEVLRLVSDEWGNPTYTADLAAAIVSLVSLTRGQAFGGIHHFVNSGVATRAEWARDVLERAGLAVATEDVSASLWPRASTPPRWGALEPSPLPSGAKMRSWPEAMADYVIQIEEHQPA